MEIRFTQDSSAFKGWGRLCSDKFSSYHVFPMVDFDRVYYIFDEGKKQILACKVRAIVFAGTEYGARAFLLLRTPTDTKTVIDYHCKLYASAEDALQSTIGNAQPIDFPKTSFTLYSHNTASILVVTDALSLLLMILLSDSITAR